MTDYDRAVALFKKFHGRAPGENDILDYEGEICLVVGEFDGVMYRTKGSKKPFLHRFKKSDRPLLIVRFDGRQIYTIKGSYRFTERGFVG